VYLFTVDDLKEVCDSNRQARLKELPKADRIIEQEADRFQADWNVRSSGLTIKQLRSMADDIKRIELDRLVTKLNGVDEKHQREIELAMDRLVNKLLHPPLESLRSEAKQGTHSGLLMALKRLFQLED
jgi:glutamyl-tRNA reductase